MKRAAWVAILLFACGTPDACPPAHLLPLDHDPSFAVVSSDYASSAIALLDEDGELLTEAWLDSGTVAPGVVAALSGDVVLSTSPVAPCVLTVIDRYGTDVVTFLDTCGADAGAVIAQIDVGSAFRANPQDAVGLDDTRAFVSRSDPNLDPDTNERERGSDLLLVDFRAGRVLSRVDLSALDVDADGEHVFARPGRMVRLAAGGTERVVVGLGRLSLDFRVSGPGGLGVVDPQTLAVSGLELPDLAACDELDAVPGEPALALVTCRGPAYLHDEEERRARTGLVLVELDERGALRVRARWEAAAHPGAPVFNTWSVPVSAERVVSVAMGDLVLGVNDRVGLIEIATSGASPILMDAGSAFVIGDGAYTHDKLLLPDGETGLVRRFVLDGAPRELDPVDTAGCRRLPPREVRPLSVE
jgi:hypothetical protein